MNVEDKALQLAGQAWCDPRTRFKTMDVDLAHAFAARLRGLLRLAEDLADLAAWMSGSPAFAQGGEAGEAWARSRHRLYTAMKILQDPAGNAEALVNYPALAVRVPIDTTGDKVVVICLVCNVPVPYDGYLAHFHDHAVLAGRQG